MVCQNGNERINPKPQSKMPQKLKAAATIIQIITVAKFPFNPLIVNEIPSKVFTFMKNISGTENKVMKIQKIPRNKRAFAYVKMMNQKR